MATKAVRTEMHFLGGQRLYAHRSEECNVKNKIRNEYENPITLIKEWDIHFKKGWNEKNQNTNKKVFRMYMKTKANLNSSQVTFKIVSQK